MSSSRNMVAARFFSLSIAAAMCAALFSPVHSVAAQSGAKASPNMSAGEPLPDPRVGLRGGLSDAATASWNMRLLSNAPPSEKFAGETSSDLAFTGHYAIQGSYNGYQVWDITNPLKPTLKTAYFCPASQSDVSVYGNLLFVSGESLTARLDCGAQEIVTEEPAEWHPMFGQSVRTTRRTIPVTRGNLLTRISW